MRKEKKNMMVPKLRFPEFIANGEWTIKPLNELATEISDKAGDGKFKLMSITSGVGLISQIEKFGREIAGDSVRNYLVIKKNDFAYNKSSTKLYPEGEIAMLENEDIGAVPNSIFTCFRFNSDLIFPPFAKYPFINNIHGRWLKSFISVGARANGALQVNTKDLFKLDFFYPKIKEQQKIASCLSSLDDIIVVHLQKLNALKALKKGLMQELFPAKGEKIPKLRFEEFKNSGEWIFEQLGKVYSFFLTNSLSRDDLNYENGSVKNIHYGDIHTKFATLFDITKEKVPYINSEINIDKIKPECYCKEGDIVFADASEDIKDIGKSVEIVHLNGEKLVAGMHTLLARQKQLKLIVGFGGILLKSNNIRTEIQRESQGTKVLGISSSRLENVKIYYPSNKGEQQKIATCLSSLDDLIKAQTEKIEQLKMHKKGLMQGLFPKINEETV